MLKLDNSLLDELGLGVLPEDQKRAMLQHIYETLELRVGTNLANQMTDQQLEEFEKFIDEGGDANQAQALQWLETNLPNYKQVVNEVFEQLKVEIKQMAPQLVAASGQAPQVPAPAPYTPQQVAPAPSNDYYSQQPVPATPYAPQEPAAPAGFGGFGAPAPAPNNGGAPAPTPAVNDFGTAGVPAPAAPDPMAAPMPQPAAPAPQAPAGFMPLPADPVAGGQQQVVQPAPTPYDQPSMPLPGSPAPQAPYNPYNQPAPQQPSQDNQGQGQGGYQFPDQQPPAGPGNYPPQHPSR